jgi:hypothetical protein
MKSAKTFWRPFVLCTEHLILSQYIPFVMEVHVLGNFLYD